MVNNKDQMVETAAINNIDVENSNIVRVELKEFHSKIYLDKLKNTKYKNKKVIFILPNGKEYK